MKTIITILALALTIVCGRADVTYTNLLTYTSVNNTTNNGNTIAIGSARLTPPTYLLQHGALNVTNDAKYYIQISLDGVNFTTISTNYASVTTAGSIDAITPGVQRLTIYSRVQFVTTNNISLGGQAAIGTGF